MAHTQIDLAAALGVSRRTIQRFTAAGMPRTGPGRGKRRKYDLAECRAWVAEREDEPARVTPEQPLPSRPAPPPEPIKPTPKIRLVHARALEIEMNLHERRGELLSKAEVQAAWDYQVRRAKARLMTLPATRPLEHPTAPGLEFLADQLIRSALAELAAPSAP